jgi:hypothetical protein
MSMAITLDTHILTYSFRHQRLYGEQIVFFHDKYGGQVIGGLWNPDSLQHRNFKPFLGYSVKPVTGTVQKVRFNGRV